MKLYFIAGEASGDARAVEVMRGLLVRAQAAGEAVEFLGAGGPQMQALAPAIDDWSAEAVVGLWDVLKKYGYFRRKFHAMLAEIEREKPDAVVFVDYPGFNLRVAKELRRRKIPTRLIYYISPQVWAWNRRRIPLMARTLDLMLCIFPFEKALYEQSGLETVFVGHPMLDTLAAKRDGSVRQTGEGGAHGESPLVGLFPGSRSREVSRIFPVMVRAAYVMAARQPGLCFEAAAATEALAAMMREEIAAAAREHGGVALPVEVIVGRSHSLMQRAAVGMVASGTATVESAYFNMPFVILYRVAPLTWEVGKRVVKVPFLGMVNILAGRGLVPEFLQNEARPEPVATMVLELLRNAEARESQVAGLQEVISGLGEGGAGERAAEAIFSALGRVVTRGV